MIAEYGLTPELTREIVETGRFLYERGWSVATSGNFSARLSSDRFAVTASGKHKGQLTEADVIVVDRAGAALTPGTPSAETLLHGQIYERFPDVQAVLHVHTVSATVLSRAAGDAVELSGYEMLKAFRGVTTHETCLRVPVVDNDQDMRALAGALELRLSAGVPGYLIRGHGLYAWGVDMAEARRHVEAFEFLFACELAARRVSA